MDSTTRPQPSLLDPLLRPPEFQPDSRHATARGRTFHETVADSASFRDMLRPPRQTALRSKVFFVYICLVTTGLGFGPETLCFFVSFGLEKFFFFLKKNSFSSGEGQLRPQTPLPEDSTSGPNQAFWIRLRVPRPQSQPDLHLCFRPGDASVFSGSIAVQQYVIE